MITKHKKDLLWIIVFIVLYLPFPLLLSLLDYSFFETIYIAVLLFVTLLIVIGLIRCVTNKIKKVSFKMLWLLLGFVIYVAYFILAINIMVPDVTPMPVGDNKTHIEATEKAAIDKP